MQTHVRFIIGTCLSPVRVSLSLARARAQPDDEGQPQSSSGWIPGPRQLQLLAVHPTAIQEQPQVQRREGIALQTPEELAELQEA